MRANYLALVQLAPHPAAKLPRFALDFPNSAIELLHLLAELPSPQPGLFHQTDLPVPHMN